ncbi:MAG: TetR/AcrR family transcriptional regulator [Bacilli bacterium]|nr:TetR/AcrR family transcriptional regulator [Bacilli bacterium]
MTKRENVINTSRNLFTQYGFKKVTMDEIAIKSGVTKKTIYSYFKDKNDLIKFFLFDEISKMKDIVMKIDEEDIEACDKVHKMIYSLLEFRREDELINKFNDKYLDIDIAKECLDILNESIISEIKRLLDKGVACEDIRSCDTHLTSFLIYKLYIAIMFEWNRPLDKTEVTESVMKFLKEGLFN